MPRVHLAVRLRTRRPAPGNGRESLCFLAASALSAAVVLRVQRNRAQQTVGISAFIDVIFRPFVTAGVYRLSPSHNLPVSAPGQYRKCGPAVFIGNVDLSSPLNVVPNFSTSSGGGDSWRRSCPRDAVPQ